ncbi:MAG TPA: aspartate aminotransferase family protein [Vicinamibacteria bacterium]|nr:aspartate aminotransferase family protein [Vicinamibacteria bacterium]
MGTPAKRAPVVGMTGAEIVAKHREYIFPSVANYYSNPVPLVRGKGKHVYDAGGREYLDFFGGILTISLGHCHPEVNAEVKEQLDTLQHVSTLYPTEPMVAVAEKLARITPGNLKKSFFTNSGTEANETAILLAQLYTGSGEILALRHSYSGRSFLAMSMTGQSSWRLGGTHVAGIKHVANAYCYRCPFGLTYPSCNLRCATDVEEAIQTTTSGKIAAFIAEPIQGVGGFITPPPEYFKIVVDIVRKYGGVFICDEVQTGWGRTGDHWCGIEHWGVEPEIMTFAKGMANGAPVGATVATAEIADSLKGSTISTFGGNPVSMTAARAVIDIIEKENLKQNARIVGDHLRAGLEALARKYPLIGDVRGKGLMQALELVGEGKAPAPKATAALLDRVREQGLLVGKGGLYGNVIRISPALNIGKADVDDALRMLDAALGEIDVPE